MLDETSPKWPHAWVSTRRRIGEGYVRLPTTSPSNLDLSSGPRPEFRVISNVFEQDVIEENRLERQLSRIWMVGEEKHPELEVIKHIEDPQHTTTWEHFYVRISNLLDGIFSLL